MFEGRILPFLTITRPRSIVIPHVLPVTPPEMLQQVQPSADTVLVDETKEKQVAGKALNAMTDLSNFTNPLVSTLYNETYAAGGQMIREGIIFQAQDPVLQTLSVRALFPTDNNGSKAIVGQLSPTGQHHINVTITTRNAEGQITHERHIDVRFRGFFTITDRSVAQGKRSRGDKEVHKVPGFGWTTVRENTITVIEEVNKDIHQLLSFVS